MNTLEDAIRSHIDKFEDQLFSGLPATILSYNANAQTATVIPVMYEAYPDGISLAFPKIENVPVIMYGSGGGCLTFPVNIGDVVFLHNSSRNFDAWWTTAKAPDTNVVQSTTQRFNDYNDVVAVLGLKTKKDSYRPHPDNVELRFEKGGSPLSSIKLLPDKSVHIISEAGSFVKMNADKSINIDSESGNSFDLKSDGSVEVITKSTIKIKNSNEELIALLSEVLQEISKITTATMLSPVSPINNIPAFTTLKARLDTLKG